MKRKSYKRKWWMLVCHFRSCRRCSVPKVMRSSVHNPTLFASQQEAKKYPTEFFKKLDLRCVHGKLVGRVEPVVVYSAMAYDSGDDLTVEGCGGRDTIDGDWTDGGG